ncbi:uncharacterized protein PFL1_02062 [Pseudozyma flocculosa PF-1]|nr:uncharacterized protein PFL1_02062 [Pseudozyma flocculosa PF-1]EPQ30537.1 hypothetical protein PFL1_02062 [Pseudozyma flocculosa PF-1]
MAEWPNIAIDRVILAPLSTLLLTTRDIILSPRTHRIVVRLGVLGAIFWTALAAAIVSYVGFYRAWVPEVGLRKDVWLQYGHEEPPFCDLRFDGPELDGRDTRSRGDFFAEDQAYDVTLELGVPLNEANLDLGNFMVSLDLRSRSAGTVFRASRPTLLTHSPAPVRALSSISQLISRNPPPSRSPPNSQILSVPLLRRVVLRPSSYAPPLSSVAADPASDRKVTHGRVTVGRHDAERYWRYGGGGGGYLPTNAAARRDNHVSVSRASRGELQTYAASLRFDAHLTGLRFFMYHYPLLSFFLFTSLFLGFELATALTLWALAAIYTSSITPLSLSLETEEHFQTERTSRRRGAHLKTEAVASDYTGESESLKRSEGSGADGDGTETETDGEMYRASTHRREEGVAPSQALPRFKTEEDAEVELQRLRSLDSLRERDAAERAEAVQSARLRDAVENRRMTGLDEGGGADLLPDELSPEVSLPRRVLGRLDEETEEETEVGGSISGESASVSAGERGRLVEAAEEERWEDLEGDGGAEAGVAGVKGEAAELASTVGGSATSGPSSIRSFGATSLGPSVTTLQSRAPTRRSAKDE